MALSHELSPSNWKRDSTDATQSCWGKPWAYHGKTRCKENLHQGLERISMTPRDEGWCYTITCTGWLLTILNLHALPFCGITSSNSVRASMYSLFHALWLKTLVIPLKTFLIDVRQREMDWALSRTLISMYMWIIACSNLKDDRSWMDLLLPLSSHSPFCIRWIVNFHLHFLIGRDAFHSNWIIQDPSSQMKGNKEIVTVQWIFNTLVIYLTIAFTFSAF